MIAVDDTHPITDGVSSFEVHDDQHFSFVASIASVSLVAFVSFVS